MLSFLVAAVAHVHLLAAVATACVKINLKKGLLKN